MGKGKQDKRVNLLDETRQEVMTHPVLNMKKYKPLPKFKGRCNDC